MNFRLANYFLLSLFIVTLSGCELIEDIFQAGMWVALFLIILVIVILVLIFNASIRKPEKGSNIIQSKTSGSGNGM